MKRNYVTAFTGRRDAYQLPLALAESGRLAAFVTCYYRGRGIVGRWGGSVAPVGRVLAGRQVDGVDPAKVECLEAVNLAARLAKRVWPPSKVSFWEDNVFARKAVEIAKAQRANLLLYEFQADWAFQQPLGYEAVKVLFQFHPHPDLEHPLLLADAANYPQFLERVRGNTRANLGRRYREHTKTAWRHADHVIVASQFTARSLEVAGCPSNRISVVPYGCSFGDETNRPPTTAQSQRRPYFLFVGSGTHRKGLHHLLEAWTQSKARQTHELVVIARMVNRELKPMLAGAPAVKHLPGVAATELAGWFTGARAFVLPSLSEGFGQVYLEALASGCPVLGTRNSMLPDFSEAQPHISYVEPADPAGLRQEIDRTAALPECDAFFDVTAVRQSVRNYTWGRFRRGVQEVLARFD